MSPEAAEKIALDALAWLAASDELFPVFLGSTGASADDIRGRAGEPDFLSSVLDFLVLDDQWVISFCDAVGYSYHEPNDARLSLSGGAEMNWT